MDESVQCDNASRGDRRPTLLSPYKMVSFDLSHRVVMAPMTRCGAINHVPQQAHVEYYSQRATRGRLIITEANAVAEEGIGFPHSPGIFTDDQIKAWSRVVEAVHEKGCLIFCQICHVCQASHAGNDEPEKFTSLTDIRPSHLLNWAMGGSILNRCRQLLKISTAVTEEIGQERTAIPISPIIDHLEATDSNPVSLGLYLAEKLNRLRLAYLHVTEPRFTVEGTVETDKEDCMWLRKAYKRTFMNSGGYDKEKGDNAISSVYAELISYDRLFISNPDLPLRFAAGVRVE